MKLKTLRLSNYQGIRALELELNGESASIYGRNATGKTTVFNAFTWLLTGKPSTDAKNYTPKTNDAQGGEVHNTDHCAEAVLMLDGGRIATVKKVYHEVYKKKRGHATAEFSGNTTDYFINGVPTKEKEYTEFILTEFGGEEQLKMLTMPDYFLQQLEPKRRREELSRIFGNVTDEEVIAANDALRDLPRFLLIPGSADQRYTVAEYRKIAASRKAAINDQLKRLPERIDEAERLIDYSLDGTGEDEINTQIDRLAAEMDELQRRRVSTNADSATSRLEVQIAEATARLAEAKGRHQAEQNRRFAAQHQKISLLEGQAFHLLKEAGKADLEAGRLADEVTRLEKKREVLNKQWFEAKRTAWDPSREICPTCNRPLPPDQIEALRGDFNQKRSDRMMEITAQGKRECSKDMINQLRSQQETAHQQAEQMRAQAASIREQSKALQDACEETPFEETEPCRQLSAEISALREQLQEQRNDPQTLVSGRELDDQIWQLRSQQNTLREQLTGLKLNRRQRERMEELSAEQQALGAEFEQVEQGLYLCECFVRTQVEMMDRHINRHFRTLRFKLFEEQNNGGLKDCCEALVPSPNGALVPYPDANDAAKLNSGLEVIGVLASHFGRSAPVFVDNAERVTDLQVPEGAQVIRLVVRKADEALRMEVGRLGDSDG